MDKIPRIIFIFICIGNCTHAFILQNIDPRNRIQISTEQFPSSRATEAPTAPSKALSSTLNLLSDITVPDNIQRTVTVNYKELNLSLHLLRNAIMYLIQNKLADITSTDKIDETDYPRYDQKSLEETATYYYQCLISMQKTCDANFANSIEEIKNYLAESLCFASKDDWCQPNGLRPKPTINIPNILKLATEKTFLIQLGNFVQDWIKHTELELL